MWRVASVFWLLVGLGVNDARTPRGRPWRISMKTANIDHAGTDASVYIILIDSNGRQSPHIYLDNVFLNDHERNSVDHFNRYDSVNLRDVCAITIYHDNTGTHPGWFLEKVWLKSDESQNDRVFNISRWVPTEQEAMESHYEVQRTPPCSEGPLP